MHTSIAMETLSLTVCDFRLSSVSVKESQGGLIHVGMDLTQNEQTKLAEDVVSRVRDRGCATTVSMKCNILSTTTTCGSMLFEITSKGVKESKLLKNYVGIDTVVLVSGLFDVTVQFHRECIDNEFSEFTVVGLLSKPTTLSARYK